LKELMPRNGKEKILSGQTIEKAGKSATKKVLDREGKQLTV
jgi:hypothetical protein